jgi:hypothetical protein
MSSKPVRCSNHFRRRKTLVRRIGALYTPAMKRVNDASSRRSDFAHARHAPNRRQNSAYFNWFCHNCAKLPVSDALLSAAKAFLPTTRF